MKSVFILEVDCVIWMVEASSELKLLVTEGNNAVVPCESPSPPVPTCVGSLSHATYRTKHQLTSSGG